jgi:hypothetical protein
MSEIRLSSVVTHASPSLHFGVSPKNQALGATPRTLESSRIASDRPAQAGVRYVLLASTEKCAHCLCADPSVYNCARELEVAPGHDRQRTGVQTSTNNTSHSTN